MELALKCHFISGILGERGRPSLSYCLLAGGLRCCATVRQTVDGMRMTREASGKKLKVGDAAPPPLALMSESEVMKTWTPGDPLVSVICPMYRHKEFVHDAMAGFLGQRTSFPFEVLVRDDGSADGTAELLREYSAAYPRIVRAFIEGTNTWPLVTPMTVLLPASRGEFIAVCDGDDYWTASDKLQRQIGGLLDSPAAVASFHDGFLITDGRISASSLISPSLRKVLTQQELQRGITVPMCSLVFRNIAPFPDEYAQRMPGGYHSFLMSWLGTLGSAIYEPNLHGCAYRVHSGGMWSGANQQERALTHATTRYWTAVFHSQAGRSSLASYHLAMSAKSITEALEFNGVYPQPRMLRHLVASATRRFRQQLKRAGLPGRRSIARKGPRADAAPPHRRRD